MSAKWMRMTAEQRWEHRASIRRPVMTVREYGGTYSMTRELRRPWWRRFLDHYGFTG